MAAALEADSELAEVVDDAEQQSAPPEAHTNPRPKVKAKGALARSQGRPGKGLRCFGFRCLNSVSKYVLVQSWNPFQFPGF